MVDDRTADPASEAGRPRSECRHSRGRQWHYVCPDTTGCQWRSLPKDLPPRSTVHGYLTDWTYDGTMKQIHRALFETCREQAERKAEPTAGGLDSQRAKSAEKGGPASIPSGMTPARRSRARSDTSWSTCSVCSCMP